MKTDWFSDARFGLFIHWGIYSIPGKGEWTLFYDDWDFDEYEKLAGQFNPVDFNPSAWAELAWNAGMRYVVFTTKHHDGFCMFDSKYTDFKITNTPYGKDIAAELVKAFREKGFKIGFYHSLVDWRHPHFIPDAEHPLWQRGQREFTGRDLKIYQEYLYNSVEQLLTEYGKIDILFFDYTSKHKNSSEWNPERLLKMIYRLQPEILVNDRLSFDKKSYPGDYWTPEISVPNAPLSIDGQIKPWETCMTMNNNWGYNRSDLKFKTPETVITALLNCISKNGNLLLNVGPDENGFIPDGSVKIMRALGEWFKRHEHAVRGAIMSKFTPPQGYFYTQKGDDIFLYLTFPPMGDIILPQLADKLLKAERMSDGGVVDIVTHWGFELLRHDEVRIRPANCVTSDIIKLSIKSNFITKS
ncbi:MAG: alpha-L-fucosidase [Victivallaceae bacterium]